MSAPLKTHVQVFDPQQEYVVVQRRLPHWSQADTISFITWRTWDSMPQRVLNTWISERNAWLVRHGINPAAAHPPKEILADPKLHREFQLEVSDRWNDHLDACYGLCVLRRRELSQIVAESLCYFDGVRYELTDYVIMPNHVHLLAAFADEDSMLQQCESWKHYTATAINRAIDRRGRFWQQDGFDHLVRSAEQFEYLRRYIATNPDRAKLRQGEYRHMSKSFEGLDQM